jgi:hypothetical protein
MGKELILKLCHFGHPNFIPAFGDASGIAKPARKIGGAEVASNLTFPVWILPRDQVCLFPIVIVLPRHRFAGHFSSPPSIFSSAGVPFTLATLHTLSLSPILTSL